MTNPALIFDKPSQSSRIAQAMEQRIASGGWPVGTWIPAMRDLAEQYGVSRKTVHGALSLLAKRNLIGRQPRRGCFVQSAPQKIDPPSTLKTQVGIISLGGDTADFQLVPDQRDWGGAIIAGAQENLLKAGKLLTMIPTHSYDQDPVKALEDRLDTLGPSLAGVFCFPSTLVRIPPRDLLQLLDRRQIPYVTINRFADSMLHNFVSIEYAAGIRLVGRCLARMGLRRVVLLEITRTDISHSALERIGGLFQGYAMEKVPTADLAVLPCQTYLAESGQAALRDYLQTHPAPQAVIALGDLLAVGAIEALREQKLRVPEDVGVIGGTGLQANPHRLPSLTTLTQPTSEIGRQVAQMLLEMERADSNRMTGRILPGKLVLRQSMSIPQEIQNNLQKESDLWVFETDQ